MAMPPMPAWYRGRDAVAGFLRGWPLAGGLRWRLVPVRANGQTAFGTYLWDTDKESFMPHGVSVVTLRRLPDRGDHDLPRPRGLRALRAAG